MPASQLRRQWPAYYNYSLDQVITPSSSGVFQVHHHKYNGHALDSTATVMDLPASAIPCDFNLTDHVWLIKHDYQRLTPTVPHLPIPNLFQDYLKTLPKWEHSLFFSLVFHKQAEAVAFHLQSGEVLMASDGAV